MIAKFQLVKWRVWVFNHSSSMISKQRLISVTETTDTTKGNDTEQIIMLSHCRFKKSSRSRSKSRFQDGFCASRNQKRKHLIQWVLARCFLGNGINEDSWSSLRAYARASPIKMKVSNCQMTSRLQQAPGNPLHVLNSNESRTSVALKNNRWTWQLSKVLTRRGAISILSRWIMFNFGQQRTI